MPAYTVIIHTTANATSHRARDVGMTEGGLSERRVTDRKFDTRDAGTDNFLYMIILLQMKLIKTVLTLISFNQNPTARHLLDLALPPSSKSRFAASILRKYYRRYHVL
jgi:hypothetical protein